MNKKITFYFLTALVVLVVLSFKTDSAPTISKYLDEKLDFWTPEKMKKAKPLTTRNIGFRKRSGVKTRRNTTDSSKHTKSMPPSERKYITINADGDQVQNVPIGKMFVHDDNGELSFCTTSVINTENGNIGLTAAHCLYNDNTNTYYNNIMFSPGYDNGQPGPYGLIPVVQAVVTNQFRDNNDNHFDWGMVKFEYNVDGHPLQFFTGSLGYTFNVGDEAATTIRGYPGDDGALENCANDGENLCTWTGQTELRADYYVMPDLELGQGASGGPLIINYDPNTNLGSLYSDYASFDEIQDDGLAPIYDPIQFQGMLSLIIGQ